MTLDTQHKLIFAILKLGFDFSVLSTTNLTLKPNLNLHYSLEALPGHARDQDVVESVLGLPVLTAVHLH